jgi:hypothetical protein
MIFPLFSRRTDIVVKNSINEKSPVIIICSSDLKFSIINLSASLRMGISFEHPAGVFLSEQRIDLLHPHYL